MLYLIPLFIGVICVLQNTLNKQLAPALGLDWALALNGLVVFCCCLLLLGVVRLAPPTALPAIFRPLRGARGFSFTDIVPGLFGFLIIAGMPWAIERMGATRVFITVIAAQLVVSLLWDSYVEKIPVSAWRLAGGALALVGTALAAF